MDFRTHTPSTASSRSHESSSLGDEQQSFVALHGVIVVVLGSRSGTGPPMAQWISEKIIRHLALHNPYPLADFALECPLCLQTWHNPATIRRGRTCGHGICTQCYSGYVTMIQKRNQHKGKTTATTTKTVGSRSVPCPLCETPF